MISLPDGFFWDSELELGEETEAIAAKVWPRFLSEPSDIEKSDLQFEMPYAEFRKRFPVWGIRSEGNKKLVAYANGVFLKVDFNGTNLPEDGWDWAIKCGARREIPNCFSLVIANVDPAYQSLKLSYKLIDQAKEIALKHKINKMIAPVRPSHRELQPDLSFEEYVNSKRPDGSPIDPWLRAHKNSGGKMLNICHRSATVEATLERWSEWTSKDYREDGNYKLEKGLGELIIDQKRNVGTYCEANVWFFYDLKK